MRELNLDRLRTLVTVAERGSFAAAAQALALAPPTVTLHVAELEQRLGAPLLLRSRGGTGVLPTGAGELLIERARRLLAEADDLADALRRHIAGTAGRVRLGAATGVIAQLLPAALQRLAAEAPGLDVQLAVLTSDQTLTRLAAGTLELGIVALPQPPRPGVEVQPWRREPVQAVLPAAWSDVPERVRPDWLAARPLVLNDAGTHLARLCADWFAGAGLAPAARITLNFNDAIRRLVAAGYGASLLPQDGLGADEGPGLQTRALQPPLWRELGLARRRGALEAGAQRVWQVLQQLPSLQDPQAPPHG
ncbi:MAG: LysR family transcriptional regulator [Burkholderiaceae bacterium]|nr:LysR family transcriptional regulator [Burkholderiaceae bacterium]